MTDDIWTNHKVIIGGSRTLNVFREGGALGLLERVGAVGFEHIIAGPDGDGHRDKWTVICFGVCLYHEIIHEFDDKYLPLIIEYLVNKGVNDIRLHR